MGAAINCQQCSSPMEKTKKVERSLVLQLLGVIFFFIGVGLLFVVPIGTFFGIVIIIAACRIGYSKKKIWKCTNCGYFFERD